MQHATCNMQHAAHEAAAMVRDGCAHALRRHHARCDMRHATCNMQHATCNMQRTRPLPWFATAAHMLYGDIMRDATCDMQHATCNMQHATCSARGRCHGS